MTAQEIINEFNLLYNNANSNAAPELDAFEISLFMTKAQLEIINNYFNPNGNKYKEGFDESIKRQHDFSVLMKTSVLKEATTGTKLDQRSLLYTYPTDLLFIINEILVLTKSPAFRTLQILPMPFTEYTTRMLKPWKEPLRNTVWRIIGDTGLAEIIMTNDDSTLIKNGYTLEYRLRYVKRPKPVVLGDFSDRGLTIEGVSGKGLDLTNPCELDLSLQREVIQRAVELAKAAQQPEEVQVQTQMGTRSE